MTKGSVAGCQEKKNGTTLHTTDKIPKLPTNTHFLFFTESSFYMVHFGLESFFLEVAKIVRTDIY